MVTLLLTPEDAEKIVLAGSEGQIMLALRNPLDVEQTKTPGTRISALYGDAPAPVPVGQPGGAASGCASAAVSPPPVAAPPPEPKPYTVETIRGAKRTEEASGESLDLYDQIPPVLQGSCMCSAPASSSLHRVPGRKAQRRRRHAPCIADGRPLDRAGGRFRHHPHRDHQSGDRRRRGGRAARNPDRRQGARHHQPDRLGRPDAARSTTWWSSRRSRRCSSSWQMLFPGEDIQVSTNEESTILSGQVSSNSVMLRAGEIAETASAKRAVINLLQVPGGNESQQVLLQVRFAEVNRRVLARSSACRFSLAAATTIQCAGPRPSSSPRRASTTTPSGLVFSDFLNLFFFDRKEGIGGLLGRSRRAARSRAWPSRT